MSISEMSFETAIDAGRFTNASLLRQAHISGSESDYDTAISRLKSYAEISDMIMRRQQAMVRQWNGRALKGAQHSADAAFDAAVRLAKSKTFPEMVAVQAEFVQAQTWRLLTEMQEAAALATQASTEMLEIWLALIETRSGKVEEIHTPGAGSDMQRL